MHLLRRYRLLWVLPFLVVACSRSADAGEDQVAGRAVLLADQIFEEFFGDTEPERKLLGEVEISPREERRFGESRLQEFFGSLQRQRIKVLRRGKDVVYLRSLVAQLHPLMHNSERYETIRIYVADTETTDAKSFPGGTIVCSKGMIEFARSEAALVGVLAHELAHIDRGHQLRRIRSIKAGQNLFSSDNSTLADFVLGGQLLAKQFARPFRPEEETEADLDGARWAWQAGYDPLEFASLFRRLHQREAQESVAFPVFLRSHPYHQDRFAAVQAFAERIQEADRQQELYMGRTNLQRRIPRHEQRFSE